MLDKMFKKTDVVEAKKASDKKAQVATAASLALANEADKKHWEAQLQTALGNDDALLHVANASPLIEIKVEAVAGLKTEAALKRAEREFREHDRRVYREVKLRLESFVKQRDVTDGANKIIESAEILLHAAHIPANRIVELDRSWQALDAQHLEEALSTRFLASREKLSAIVRERGEQRQSLQRWIAEATLATSEIDAHCNDVLLGTADADVLRAASAEAETLLESAESANDVGAKNLLASATQNASGIVARLALLTQLEASTAADEPALAARWPSLPPMPSSQFLQLLDARFALWLRTKMNADVAQQNEIKKQAKAESVAASKAQHESLGAMLVLAETAITEGHLADVAKQLGTIETATKKLQIDGKLQTRIANVQAEYARLRGWQHWSGGVARDDLVKAAEELAAASAAEVSKQEAYLKEKEQENATENTPENALENKPDSKQKPVNKIPVKALADAIDELRERWKELDKLGAAGGKSKWTRFDAALKTAYVPVGVHLDKLKAQRKENLAARNALIVELDKVVLADIANGETPDWRALARSLEHFNSEWRKCGPLEHTVQRKSQAALSERMKKSVARLETPLEEARGVEQRQREKLIERAKALSADAQSRDAITKVRDLQTEWQKQAKGLPLARQVENALWSNFKAAIDAVFTTRDAAYSARDAELKAHQTTREALIAKLATLSADTSAADIKRTLFEIDGEWRKAGEAPKAVAAKIDAKYRAARDTAQKFLAGSAARSWQLVCDAMLTKLALCVEAENSAGVDIERWTSAAASLPLWDKALQARYEKSSSATTETLPQILLQLESALEVESPAAFQAARRELKLLAMKRAIEARQTVTISNADIQGLLAAALRFARIDAASSDRLNLIIAAVRNKPLR